MRAISHILTTFSRLNFKGTKRKTFKKTIIQSESKTVNSDIGRGGCTKIRQNPGIAKIGCIAKQNPAKYAMKAGQESLPTCCHSEDHKFPFSSRAYLDICDMDDKD